MELFGGCEPMFDLCQFLATSDFWQHPVDFLRNSLFPVWFALRTVYDMVLCMWGVDTESYQRQTHSSRSTRPRYGILNSINRLSVSGK